MGCTGGESLPLSLSVVRSQGAKDEDIGGDKNRKNEHTHQSTVGGNKKSKDVSVRAGEFQQREKVTDEMVNDIGATEGQPEYKKNLDQSMKKSPSPGQGHQKATHSPVHCGYVLQGLADGHIAVIGHPCEDKDLQATKEVKSEKLCHAVFVGNGLPFFQ